LSIVDTNTDNIQPISEEKRAKGEPVGLYLQPGLLDILVQLAKTEDRSKNWIINKLIREALQRRGML
jgi:hypothetical protein